MRKKLTISVLSLCAVFSALSLPSHAADPVPEPVKACFLEWGKQGGKHLPEQGFNPDLVSTVLREAGYAPTVDILPWVRCLEEVKKHTYAFVAGYWRGKEGDKYFDYFRPTTVDNINFIVLKNSPLDSGRIDDMKGVRVGYLRGAGGLETFRSNIDKFIATEIRNDTAMIKMLKHGRIDAIVSNSPHITSLAESSFPELVGKLRVLEPPIQVNIASPAISLTHPKRAEMKARYNKAYDKLVKKGLYERLMTKHKFKTSYKTSAGGS